MLKIAAQILIFMLAASGLYAQDCKQEALATLPGKWKKGQQGSIHNVTATDLAQEKAVLNNIQSLLTENYQPTGCEVAYSTVFGKYPREGEKWLADPYHLQYYILRFLCDPNSADKSKYYTDISTTTTVQVVSNAIYQMQLYAANIPATDFRGYLRLDQRPVKKDGVYFMGEVVEGDSHRKDKIMQYSWLITYDDALPFSYISRKEYLRLIQKKLAKTMDEQSDQVAYFAPFKKRIENFLEMDDEFLSEPAVCMYNDEERFNGFVTEGTPGSFIAIKPNLDYYRNNLKLSTPQFFYVTYKITQNEPVFENNIAGLMKALDFEKLKSMLGKEAKSTAPTTQKPVKKINPKTPKKQ